MDKKNIILGAILLLSTHISYAQSVGINTENPQTTLDVNGAIQVRKEIKLGNAEGVAGSPGSVGYGFASQGVGKNPVWAPLTTIQPPTGLGITQSFVLNDSDGARFLRTYSDTNFSPEFLEDSGLNTANGWVELSNLKAEVIPTSPVNRLVITLQTVGQSSLSIDVDAVFAVGVFLDGKLKCVRPLQVMGSDYAFATGTLFDSFENLPPKANSDPYVIQVAAIMRYNRDYPSSNPGAIYYYLGTSPSSTPNSNNLMNMTTIKLELYEDTTK
ncbi:MAG: hypothetical protein E6772_15815 [Dysgonomonas sp.]|nr:hypothetical protein [Dysgonomonas sp.]